MKILRTKKVNWKRVEFLDDMTEQEIKIIEKEKEKERKEEIHKKIIDNYTITDQLNIIRRVVLELSNDPQLKKLTDFIDPLLKK